MQTPDAHGLLYSRVKKNVLSPSINVKMSSKTDHQGFETESDTYSDADLGIAITDEPAAAGPENELDDRDKADDNGGVHSDSDAYSDADLGNPITDESAAAAPPTGNDLSGSQSAFASIAPVPDVDLDSTDVELGGFFFGFGSTHWKPNLVGKKSLYETDPHKSEFLRIADSMEMFPKPRKFKRCDLYMIARN